jgi:hypothetical protein
MLSVALVFGLGIACGGSNNAVLAGSAGPAKSPGIGDGGSDAGDGGVDAGADAGSCVAFARPITSVADGCRFFGGQLPATMIRPDAGCGATLLTTPNLTCTGILAGPTNAFTAVCTGIPPDLFCTSNSTPGVLRCMQTDGGGECLVRICDTATCI